MKDNCKVCFNRNSHKARCRVCPDGQKEVPVDKTESKKEFVSKYRSALQV